MNNWLDFKLFLFSRVDKLVEGGKSLKVTAGTEPDADLGPVISKQVRTWKFLFFPLLPEDQFYDNIMFFYFPR